MPYKNVLLFTYDLNPGGAEHVLATVANSLVYRGHTVTVALVRKEGILLKRLDDRVSVVGLDSNHVLKSALPLVELIKKLQPQIIFSTLKECNTVAIISSKISRVKSKIIIREANTLSAEVADAGFFNRITKEALIRNTYYRADKIIALSNHMKQDVIEYLNVDKDLIEVIYNPLDIDKLKSMSDEDVSDFEFDIDYKYYCTTARLVPHKRHDTTIRAISLLNSSYGEKAKLLIFGTGPEIESLKKLSDSLGVAQHIHFMGFKENPFKYYKHCQGFILSSEYEGMPNSLIQALAIGLQVFASESPGANSEIINHDGCGALFKIGDYEQLAMLLNEKHNFSSFNSSPYHVEVVMSKYMSLFES